VSYAGEAGWELYLDPAWSVQVWDRLVEAGDAHGLVTFGYRALDSLRLEKGFRYYGTDLTMLDTPVEAGLLRFVAFDKGEFTGREALLKRRDAGPPATRLRTIVIGTGDAWQPVYGGEAVRFHGETVGRLRSAGYGHTVCRTLGYVYLPAHLGEGSEVEVDVFAERVPAVVVPDAVAPGRAATTLGGRPD
jgi:4-methylaminobutanoate oxidase (formaldehyde-forming)